jgi:dipeptidyl aminopeptidase/acylaminoacyl peptidase
MVVLTGDVQHPAELVALPAAPGGVQVPVSRANDEWLASLQIVAAEEVRVSTAEGVNIHGLLMRPPVATPGKPMPLLVRLHGGPVYQFSHEFAFDMQWFAARGFAVLAVNPRGSSGRGLDFSRAIYADWGGVDVSDVLAMVDHLVQLGVADPQQLVIGGHSYGGYLTNYVIARDKRFKAAYSSAGASNALGLYGADMYVRDYEAELGLPWTNLEPWLRISYPFFKADRIVTPTLFLCNGNDFNVPCVGAQQMYQALRSLNVPTRLIRFPNQGHTLNIPSYLEFRLKSYLEWFERYLGR